MRMTAEEILGILVGKGFLVNVGQMSEDRRPPRRRPPADDEAATDRHEKGETAHGRSSRSRKPAITQTEFASDCLVGMPARYWEAIQVATGADTRARHKVTARLLNVVSRSMDRDGVMPRGIWPDKLRRRPCTCGRLPADAYHLDLIELAIRELEDPGTYSIHRQRAEWFGLSEQHWRKMMRQPYGVVWGELQGWFENGISHIERRLAKRSKSVN